MEREIRQLRSATEKFTTREDDGGAMHISGYFAVFDSDYNIAPGLSESIAKGAFTSSMDRDVRALINHDDTLVIGRTTAGTLELRQDDHGLWGDILINPKDSDATNAYARVERGDVSQCSFGFNILAEETDYRSDGSIHWTITDIELFEVSVCTFPAYEETGVKAREKQAEEIKQRRLDAWKIQMRSRLKGEEENVESTEDEEAARGEA